MFPSEILRELIVKLLVIVKFCLMITFGLLQVTHPLMVSASIDRAHAVPSLSTNQNSEEMSHDLDATPPDAVVTPSLFKVPPAPKSEAPLRRSTRLKTTAKARLSEHMIHVSVSSLCICVCPMKLHYILFLEHTSCWQISTKVTHFQ